MVKLDLSADSAERSAEDLLKSEWAPISGNPHVVPIDPIRIAHALGITVHVGELPANVSGRIAMKPGADPIITINWDDHPNRARFSCAHELGHFVHREGEEEYSYTDYRGPLSSTGQSAEERFANQFAAALLMPADAVRSRHAAASSVAQLASEFRVSADAMRYRLMT